MTEALAALRAAMREAGIGAYTQSLPMPVRYRFQDIRNQLADITKTVNEGGKV